MSSTIFSIFAKEISRSYGIDVPRQRSSTKSNSNNQYRNTKAGKKKRVISKMQRNSRRKNRKK